jgi:hypothetical protein
VFVLHEYKAVTHRFIVTAKGDADSLWNAATDDVPCHVTAGSLPVFPCDSGVHSLGVTATGIDGESLFAPFPQFGRAALRIPARVAARAFGSPPATLRAGKRVARPEVAL